MKMDLRAARERLAQLHRSVERMKMLQALSGIGIIPAFWASGALDSGWPVGVTIIAFVIALISKRVSNSEIRALMKAMEWEATVQAAENTQVVSDELERRQLQLR